MIKGVGIIIFLLFFVIFLVVKFLIKNGKKAYSTVFYENRINKTFGDQVKIRKALEICVMKMDIYLSECGFNSSSSDDELAVMLKYMALICHQELSQHIDTIDIHGAMDVAMDYLIESRGLDRERLYYALSQN